jgi:pilus assembly protein CpaE
MATVPVKTLVTLDTGVDRNIVEAALQLHQSIQIVGFVEGLDEGWETLLEVQADLLVIACSGYSERTLVLTESSRKQRPGRPVVVLCEGSPNGFVRRVFEAGADDIVTLPETPAHIEFALQKAVARKQGTMLATSTSVAPVVCVLGPKGGTGKTLTSVNVAVSLAETGAKVLLVDLDLQFGDVALCMGLSPERTIVDLVRSGGSLDSEKLEAYLVPHASGARVLVAPNRPDQASVVTVEFLRELYAVARASNDYVIIDTPPGFTPEVIATIDASTDIVMVGMLDSLSLKNTKLGLETLDLMGYRNERISLVLNRADSRVGITGRDVTTIVGRKPDILVPSDREIPRAVNEGLPIVTAKRNSEAAKSFRALSAILSRPREQEQTGGAKESASRGGRMRLREKKA